MPTITDSPSPINRIISQVVELTSTYRSADGSPWSPRRFVHEARLDDGRVVEMETRPFNELVAALRADPAVALMEGRCGGFGRTLRVERKAADESQALQRPATLEAALAEMVAKGTRSKPGLAKRLESAAGLVRDGLVALVDGHESVQTEARIGPYRISAEACTCADYTHRGGWCKHRLAARMARHLCASGFALPQRAEPERCPPIRRGDLALIASGRVIDESRRREMAYRESGQGQRDRALRMVANGAGSLPADLARRVGIVRVTSDEAGGQ